MVHFVPEASQVILIDLFYEKMLKATIFIHGGQEHFSPNHGYGFLGLFFVFTYLRMLKNASMRYLLGCVVLESMRKWIFKYEHKRVNLVLSVSLKL